MLGCLIRELAHERIHRSCLPSDGRFERSPFSCLRKSGRLSIGRVQLIYVSEITERANLREFLDTGHHNTLATQQKKPAEFQKLDAIHNCFTDLVGLLDFSADWFVVYLYFYSYKKRHIHNVGLDYTYGNWLDIQSFCSL